MMSLAPALNPSRMIASGDYLGGVFFCSASKDVSLLPSNDLVLSAIDDFDGGANFGHFV